MYICIYYVSVMIRDIAIGEKLMSNATVDRKETPTYLA